MGMVHYVRPGSKLRILAGDTPTWISNSRRAGYIRQVCLSAPLWVGFKDFALLRLEALWATVMTGELHVLDHIIPLNHPRVCGLTVPWNLRVVHWRVNVSKGNDWCPEQGELW